MGTPANFNGFHVLASLLQRRRSPEANKTLHDAWPSPALVHYIYIFGGSCSLTEFCQLQYSLCVQVLRSLYWQRYCTALEQRPSATLCVLAWYKEWNYGIFAEEATYIRAGRSSRWASAHIVVQGYTVILILVFVVILMFVIVYMLMLYIVMVLQCFNASFPA